jgi:hypothetical protein
MVRSKDLGAFSPRVASAVTLASLLALAGCGGGGTTSDAGMVSDAGVASDSAGPATIEIAGRYDDGFGTTHVIDAAGWSMTFGDSTSRFAFTMVDDAEDFAIAENDAANMFSPGLYSRFEWVRVGEQLYFCQAPFDAATEAAALAAARPDRSDPTMTGCGTFAWSPLTPVTP